jgi:polysaccharide export outer membrane protein
LSTIGGRRRNPLVGWRRIAKPEVARYYAGPGGWGVLPGNRRAANGCSIRIAFQLNSLIALASLAVVGGCSILPYDGPTSHEVNREAKRPGALYAIVDLDYGATQTIAALPPVVLAGLAGNSSAEPTDVIADGDILAISVFEAGPGGLFSRAVTTEQMTASGGDQQTIPRIVVDRGGDLQIPFAGLVHVAGLTPAQAQEAIRRALRGRAIDPQVTVNVLDSRANSVTILGEVRSAGHFTLSPHNDHLLDVVASAGGPTRPLPDLRVVVMRGGRSADADLASLLSSPGENIRLAPQDQIQVLYEPRKYSTFGALGRIAQTPIEDASLTLAAALSRAGGLDSATANAASVLLFRFERPEVAAALGVTNPPTAKGVPIVYRLNLKRADGFFIANNFYIKSDDLMYVARSDLTETEKFLSVVNTATQVVYNVRVSTVLP